MYGDGTLRQFFTAIVELGMSLELKREWIRDHKMPTVIPPHKDLLEFLRAQRTLLNTSKTYKQPTDNYKVYRHPEKTSSPEPVTGH